MTTESGMSWIRLLNSSWLLHARPISMYHLFSDQKLGSSRFSILCLCKILIALGFLHMRKPPSGWSLPKHLFQQTSGKYGQGPPGGYQPAAKGNSWGLCSQTHLGSLLSYSGGIAGTFPFLGQTCPCTQGWDWRGRFCLIGREHFWIFKLRLLERRATTFVLLRVVRNYDV